MEFTLAKIEYWYNKNYISLDKIEKAFDYGKYEIAERIIL